MNKSARIMSEDITLSDLLSTRRQLRTIVPWGLSFLPRESQGRAHDVEVIIDPRLTLKERQRQIRVATTQVTYPGTPMVIGLLAGLCAWAWWAPKGLGLAATVFVAVCAGVLAWKTSHSVQQWNWHRIAPARHRMILAEPSVTTLRRVLMNLAIEHRRWSVPTPLNQEAEVLDDLWGLLTSHGTEDLLSVAEFLDQKYAITPLVSDGQR